MRLKLKARGADGVMVPPERRLYLILFVTPNESGTSGDGLPLYVDAV